MVVDRQHFGGVHPETVVNAAGAQSAQVYVEASQRCGLHVVAHDAYVGQIVGEILAHEIEQFDEHVLVVV